LNDKYILDEAGNVVEEPDLMKWAKWFETADRHVRNEEIEDVRISTVFLGLNHAWREGPPILWETMVFGGKLDLEYERCSGSREQAEAMHFEMRERVQVATEALEKQR